VGKKTDAQRRKGEGTGHRELSDLGTDLKKFLLAQQRDPGPAWSSEKSCAGRDG
jgi:hypothetical protein